MTDYSKITDLTPISSTGLSAGLKCVSATRKGQGRLFQHIGIYFNHIGRFENELTQLAEPTEQEIRQMREGIEEARKEKSRTHNTALKKRLLAYSRRYPAICREQSHAKCGIIGVA